MDSNSLCVKDTLLEEKKKKIPNEKHKRNYTF